MIEQNENVEWTLPSKAFSELLSPEWNKTQDYEQLLNFLSSYFNPVHEQINGMLDFFDVNKVPENFLKMLAFNLGAEIPTEEDMIPFAKTIIQNAINVYRTKGTFDANHTSSRGIGLWIKAATGYDISITALPVLNPFMFVNQFNYRCALLTPGTGGAFPNTAPLQAIHPYTKQELAEHELPHYATGGTWMHYIGVAVKNVDYGFFAIRLKDMDTGHTYNIPMPSPSVLVRDAISFSYNNRFYALFGFTSSNAPVSTVMSIPFVSKETYGAQHWTDGLDDRQAPQSVYLPVNITRVEVVNSKQRETFRNLIYFMGKAIHTNASVTYKICVFDVILRTLTFLPTSEALTSTSLVTFSATKAYYIGLFQGTSSIRTIQVIDLQTGEENRLSLFERDYHFSGISNYYSIAMQGHHFYFLVDNRKLIIYDFYSDTAVTVQLAYAGTGGNLLCSSTSLCLAVNGMTPIVLTYNLDNLLKLSEGDVAIPDGWYDSFLDLDVIIGMWEGVLSSGSRVYPPTLVVNVESRGEFQSDRTLYGRKIEFVKTFVDRYTQSGTLTVINDDN